MSFNASGITEDCPLQISSIKEIEKVYHASMTNEPGKRASLNQGKCFLRIVIEAFASSYPNLEMLANAMGKHTPNSCNDLQISGHYAIIFGSVCRILNISLAMCFRMYLRILLRDLVSAASRLNIIGPLEGANMQSSLGFMLEEMVQDMLTSCHDKLQLLQPVGVVPVQISPFLDIIQSRHDLLYSRLFNS